MMTREQFLLLKVMEECAELAQVASKTMQFGRDERRHGDKQTNMQRMNGEFNDLMAIIHELNTKHGYQLQPCEFTGAAKMEKVDKYYQYSQEIGTVLPDPIPS